MIEPNMDEVRPAVRTLQIIVASMLVGIGCFGAYVLLIAPQPARPEAAAQMLTLISLACGAGSLLLAPVISATVTQAQLRRIAASPGHPSQPPVPAQVRPANTTTDAGQLAAAYSTKTIIGAALCEGTCILALVAYMTERHWAAILVAGLSGAALLAHLPTHRRVAEWVEDRLRRLVEMRQFRG